MVKTSVLLAALSEINSLPLKGDLLRSIFSNAENVVSAWNDLGQTTVKFNTPEALLYILASGGNARSSSNVSTVLATIIDDQLGREFVSLDSELPTAGKWVRFVQELVKKPSFGYLPTVTSLDTVAERSFMIPTAVLFALSIWTLTWGDDLITTVDPYDGDSWTSLIAGVDSIISGEDDVERGDNRVPEKATGQQKLTDLTSSEILVRPRRLEVRSENLHITKTYLRIAFSYIGNALESLNSVISAGKIDAANEDLVDKIVRTAVSLSADGYTVDSIASQSWSSDSVQREKLHARLNRVFINLLGMEKDEQIAEYLHDPNSEFDKWHLPPSFAEIMEAAHTL